MNRWATLIIDEEAEPAGERIVRQSRVEHLTIVFLPSADAAPEIARSLVEEGATLIELCGGFGFVKAAAVAEAVAGRAAVGAVAFGFESLDEAARYKQSFGS